MLTCTLECQLYEMQIVTQNATTFPNLTWHLWKSATHNIIQLIYHLNIILWFNAPISDKRK